MPKSNEEFEDRMENLFSDNPEPKDEDQKDIDLPDDKDAKDDTLDDSDDKDDSTEDKDKDTTDDQDVDYDAPDKKEDVKDDDDDIPDESAARKQAKLRGKEAKELKVKLQERDLELERIKQEAADTRARLEEIEAIKVKPEDHEDYRTLRDGVLSDVRGAARRLTGDAKTLLPNVFGKLMGQYLASSDVAPENVVEEDEKLAGQIITTLKLSDIPYADLEADERAALQPAIDKVLDVLERNAGKTKDLQKLHTTLSEKAKTGQLSVGVRQYESRVAKLKPILDSVGDMADDLIEANPYAIGSVVAKLIKSSPEAAKRAQRATEDALEFVLGPRVLTQREIDSLESKGENVKEYLIERQKLFESKQGKFAAMFKEGLLTRSLLKETLQKLAKYEKQEEGEESELDAIRKTTKKKTAPAPPTKKAWSIDSLFTDD